METYLELLNLPTHVLAERLVQAILLADEGHAGQRLRAQLLESAIRIRVAVERYDSDSPSRCQVCGTLVEKLQ